ncbi:MAG: DUF3810 domain-containing protein [Oscillospiraceae bacterium]|nr:DUF3810 domain-containing protein [Oscillospiraceae bacterium]
MKHRTSFLTMLVLWLLCIGVNVLAHVWPQAADWYIQNAFPALSDLWSFLTGWLPFSLGEWLIVAGLCFAALVLVSFPLCMLLAKKRRRSVAAVYGEVCGWVLTWLFSVLTMHFFVLYQGTPLSETLGEVTYTNTEVLDAYEALVQEANALSLEVERDDTGHMVLRDDPMEEAKACMQRLGGTYPQYVAYYPDAKAIHHAYFFTQQGLLGIYYPFTMEANYNPAMYDVNLPVTLCHEYTHLRGNIFEDEAGYYAYKACMTSADPQFRYSALVSVLGWLELDLGDDAAAQERLQEIDASMEPGLCTDMYSFVPAEYIETHADEEILPTSLVSEVADTVMDTSLKVNGVSDGIHSYHGLTALVLHDRLGGE